MCFRPSSAATGKVACPMCGFENDITADSCAECGFTVGTGAATPGVPSAPGAPKAPMAPKAPAVPSAPKAPRL